MGRGGQGRSGDRGSNTFEDQGARNTYDNRWDPRHPDQDPSRDIRDIYEEAPDPVTEEYLWPEQEEDED
jgi:hypothetical protein